MSNYRGHIAGGAAAGTAYAAVLLLSGVSQHPLLVNAIDAGAIFPFILIVTATLFGLWPDIDTNSKGQDIFFGGMLILNIGLILLGAYELSAFLGLLAMLPIVGKHRGWTHSRWAMLLVPSPILIVPYLTHTSEPLLGLPYYGAAVIGIASHLLLDGLLFRRPRF